MLDRFKQRMEAHKGFTLVELMIVIAIIGILAAVLIPKMGFMKDTAKDAGMASNVRVVEATVNSLLPGNTVPATFNTALVAKLSGNVTNPYSKSTAAVTTTSTGAAAPAVVTYAGPSATAGTGTDDAAHDAWAAPSNVNLSGTVVVCTYVSNGTLTVDLVYHDGTGTLVPLTDKIKIK